jgi:hypothetical protein
MSAIAIRDVSYEKGWGVFFDVVYGGDVYRFSISAETLAGPGLKHSAKRQFPDTFDANTGAILDAALRLIESGGTEARPDIGGTEILTSHLKEHRDA